MTKQAIDTGLSALSNKELEVLRALAAKKLRAVTVERLKFLRIEIDQLIEGSGISESELAIIMGFSSEQQARHRRGQFIYINPSNPDQVWHGLGARPHWLVDLLESGVPMESVRSSATDKVGRKAPIKFANPSNPLECWSGRGRMPKWVVQVINSGESLDSLRV